MNKAGVIASFPNLRSSELRETQAQFVAFYELQPKRAQPLLAALPDAKLFFYPSLDQVSRIESCDSPQVRLARILSAQGIFVLRPDHPVRVLMAWDRIKVPFIFDESNFTVKERDSLPWGTYCLQYRSYEHVCEVARSFP